MYLFGFAMMAWNLWKTARAGVAVNGETTVVVGSAEDEAAAGEVPSRIPGWARVAFGRPPVLAAAILVPTLMLGWAKPFRAVVLMGAIMLLGELAWWMARRDKALGRPSWFALVERKPFAFTVFTLIAILIGGIAELLPTIAIKQAVPEHGEAQKPYSPLELEGRDLYVREGCYVCHSQMIRPFATETQRYGEMSRAEEFIYDRPFQWGSKRTGPDLHRVGGKYPDIWHYQHLLDPRSTSPGSNMPSFAWLEKGKIKTGETPKKLALMQKLGVPYTNKDVDGAEARLKAQAETITTSLATQGVKVEWDSELVALISYLQRLGRGPQDLAPAKTMPSSPTGPVAGGAPNEGTH
jgi:cytochrome c oxidase cbb3-type subunit I/II